MSSCCVEACLLPDVSRRRVGARADWVPKQPIKILVGYAPGGTADIAARIAADTLQRKHGLAVVVDNKTGAGGFIALKACRKRRPTATRSASASWASSRSAPVVPGSHIPLDLDKELVPSPIWSACRWR